MASFSRPRIIFTVFLIFLGAIFLFAKIFIRQESPRININEQRSGSMVVSEQNNLSGSSLQKSEELNTPLENFSTRVTKKPFGIYVTPQNSPVQPERFIGYHTGTDFEITPQELNQEIIVRAICDGKILEERKISGYGGVIVEACKVNNQAVMVLYGHLSFRGSALAKVGNDVNVGDALAVLGANKSVDTDGERRHLHLSIHKGEEIVYLGYVQKKEDLQNWINPMDYLVMK